MRDAASRQARWTKGKIVAALRARHAKGQGVNNTAIRKSNLALLAAINRHFGTVTAALCAAGIDLGILGPRRGEKWNKESIAAALCDRQAKGLGLNSTVLQKADLSLLGASYRYFGTLRAALRAAGIDLGVLGPRGGERWNKEGVAAALRDRQAKGLGLNGRSIRTSEAALFRAIYWHFGTLPLALRAAGIDPIVLGPRKGERWNKEGILAALRDRKAKGLRLNSWSIATSENSLLRAIYGHFGKVSAALCAAGIDPGVVRAREHRGMRRTRLRKARADAKAAVSAVAVSK